MTGTRLGTRQADGSRCSVAPMEESLDSWFKREILSHEEILTRFLARVWRRPDEVPDLRQEAYARVYEAAQRARPHMPKAFLFSTARHLMTDRVRRERIVSIRAGGDGDFLNVLVDEISPEQHVSAGQELARLGRAFDRLSNRCREVLWLRRVRELSQKEVASRLGLSEKTVEKHLRTAVRLLAQYTGASGAHPGTSEHIAQNDDEKDHERKTRERD
jgi:RNA polymerase sigma factor (sigma-70 family)